MGSFDFPILICGDQFSKQLKGGTITVLDFAPLAKRVGVQGVEYRTRSWKDQAKELPLVRDQVRDMGIIATYGTFTTLFNRDAAEQQQLMQDLEDASAIGAQLIRTLRGERPGQGPEDAHIWKATRAFLKRAEDIGMPVALENFGRAPGNSWQEVKQAIEDLSSPGLGTLVDIGNYVRQGFDVMEAIQQLKPWIRDAYLKDVKATPEGPKVTYPGDGTLPYREILKAFADIGRRFPLTLEFGIDRDPEAELKRGLEYVMRMATA